MSNAVVDVLLVLGVAAQLICAIGLVVMRTTADRLHYAAGAYTLGPFFVLVALIVREQLSAIGLDSIAAVGLLFLAGPIVAHATARALRRIDYGDLAARPTEKVDG